MNYKKKKKKKKKHVAYFPQRFIFYSNFKQFCV